MCEVRKNIVPTLFSILLIVFSNIASAVTCSNPGFSVFNNKPDLNLMTTACPGANVDNGSLNAMNSGEFFDISDRFLPAEIVAGIANEGSSSPKGGKPVAVKGVIRSVYLLTQKAFEDSEKSDFGNKGRLKALSQLTDSGSGAVVVPVPAALWLFSSGLLALLALSRRKPL